MEFVPPPTPPPTPHPAGALSRRQTLRLGLGVGLGLGAGAVLAGCQRGQGPQLLTSEGSMPQAWLKALPAPWESRLLPQPTAVAAATNWGGQTALVQLSDGWASGLDRSQLQPFGAPQLLARLSPAAAAVSRLFGPPGSPVVAFPWAFSPWVIVLRNRPDLAEARNPNWDLLLDPSLRGKVVLPSSPRLSIELIGAALPELRALRRQALAYDDRDGLNLVLSGDAEAAVLPLQRLVPLLRRDSRLQVVLPRNGAPLNWQLLLRPAGITEPLPLGWLGDALAAPLLPTLLGGGWVPPLPSRDLAPLLKRFPAPLAELLLPAEAVLQRCWSLPPLNSSQQLALQTLWDAAAP